MVFSNGILAVILSGYERNTSYVLVDVPGYDGPPISLAMPVDKRAFTFDRFPAFFAAFLPEGRNYEEFLKCTGLERDDYMSQLLAVGRHSKITVQDYDEAKKADLSGPKLPLKSKKKK
jgi:serine/threonine-protein kinase HipA